MDPEKKQRMLEKIEQRAAERKKMRKIFLIITGILFAIVLGLGIYAYIFVTSALEPVDETSEEIVKIEVPLGSGVTTIANILQENGLVQNAKVFKYYAKFKNESQFQAGEYELMKSMTLDELIESLKTGTVYREPVFTVTYNEGWTLEQIAVRVEEKTTHTAAAFLAKVNDPSYIQELAAKFPTLINPEEMLAENVKYPLEGYLYPATYPYFEENPPLTLIIEQMIEETNKYVVQYQDAIAANKWINTPHKFLTFSSLLEKEATGTTDRATIASVFFNRLAEPMPLQTDPTVLYALGEHKDRVLYKDLEVQDPYNTYQNAGLPPGPIATAGATSFEAALSPSKTSYLYFLADKDGKNHFAETYAEHQANVAKYINTQYN
ncbi:endolytic transglycosylase MltG [Caryophanon latum]|nr:endolytic transglycosylase MltG [Caryophanon latum]